MGNQESQPFSAVSHYSNVHTHTHVHAWKSSLQLRAKDICMHTTHSGLYHFVASRNLVFSKFNIEC